MPLVIFDWLRRFTGRETCDIEDEFDPSEDAGLDDLDDMLREPRFPVTPARITIHEGPSRRRRPPDMRRLVRD